MLVLAAGVLVAEMLAGGLRDADAGFVPELGELGLGLLVAVVAGGVAVLFVICGMGEAAGGLLPVCGEVVQAGGALV